MTDFKSEIWAKVDFILYYITMHYTKVLIILDGIIHL